MKASVVLEYLVKFWCVLVGRQLQLDSYLLSKKDLDEANQTNTANNDNARPNERRVGQENAQQQPNDLAGRHHALLIVRENQEIETYNRPNNFHLRLAALLLCLALTIVLLSLILLVIPGNLFKYIVNEER